MKVAFVVEAFSGRFEGLGLSFKGFAGDLKDQKLK